MAMYLRAAILQATVLQGAFIWPSMEKFCKNRAATLPHGGAYPQRRMAWTGANGRRMTPCISPRQEARAGAVPEERPEWVRILSEDELEPYSRERVPLEEMMAG